MSTNRKNRDKPVLRNQIQSQHIDHRNVIGERRISEADLLRTNDYISEITQALNRIIPNRNIPYLQIHQTAESFDVGKARVFIRSEASSRAHLDDLRDRVGNSQENTYLVEVFVNDNGYFEIGYSSENNITPAGLSNFALVDEDFLTCTLADIFLDSEIFNSYSFLKNMSYDEKRQFNSKKVDFLKTKFGKFKELDSTFYEFTANDYDFLSIAFFTRKSQDDIGLMDLIALWDEFIDVFFHNYTHTTPPVSSQLQTHVDYKQFSNKIEREAIQKPKGTYWLLRIRSRPANEAYRRWMFTIFGSAEIGEERIIDFERFDSVYGLVRTLHVSALKFIVP